MSLELWSTLDCNIGLIIACLPALRQFFKGKKGSGYNIPNGYNKASANGAPNGVLEVTNEPYETRKSNGKHRSRRLSSNSDGFDDEPWDDRKKSTGSDVELVQIKIVEP